MARETNSRFGTAASFGMVAVVIGALSGALYWQSQLTTSRPAPSAGEPAPRRPPGKVRARLWEDPLAAVRHQVGLPCGERGSAPDGSPGLVLPVYLWGGDSFEDHENRLRSRYAVLAALDAAGYMPEDAEHLRFRCLAAGTVIVPYEWFFRNPLQPASRAGTVSRPPSPGWESILVIWVSDQLLSARPLESLHQALNELRSGLAAQAPTHVLGPSHSNGLRAMLVELEDPRWGPEWKPTVFSSWATAERTLLGLSGSTPERGEPSPITRTIATDRELAVKLIQELKDRGVDARKDRIALVSEWDTWYGRALPLTFAAQVKSGAEGVPFGPALEEVQKQWPVHLASVYYLRGLDGQVPAARPSEKSGTPRGGEAAPREEEQRAAAAVERPHGQGQFDYARRLAEKLAAEGGPGTSGLAAIGVLGSDLYDKLLLLQALRPRFPGALFFTTDLDARLLHPSENRWARNLLVASSFGLEPPGAGVVRPPFRSNYQTALYVATLRALEGIDPQEADKAKEAQVFEVGRTRALRLPDENESGNPHLLAIRTSVLALALLLVLWVAWRQVRVRQANRSWSRWLPYGGFLLVVALAWVFVTRRPGPPEPFAPLEGISTWPSEMLRLAAAFLAFHFLVTLHRRLSDNAETLRTAFNLPECPQTPAWLSAAWWKQWSGVFAKDWSSPSGALGVGQLWEQYQTCERPASRWMRVVVSSALYLVFGVVLVFSFGQPVVPYRGETSRLADRLILFLTVPLLVLLTFWVLDATLLCERFVRTLVRQLHSAEAVKSLAEFGGASPARAEGGGVRSVWRLMDLIAQRTEAVAPAVLYPFLVLVPLILSRSHFFDRWDWPPALVGIWSVNSIFIIICAMILRGAAESARRAASECLRQQRLEAQGAKQEDRVKLLGLAIEHVERERRGSFAPLVEQPALRALLLPFGGLGAGFYLEPLIGLF